MLLKLLDLLERNRLTQQPKVEELMKSLQSKKYQDPQISAIPECSGSGIGENYFYFTDIIM